MLERGDANESLLYFDYQRLISEGWVQQSR